MDPPLNQDLKWAWLPRPHMIIMNEDEIIRKRLMVEGDSGQDDRRITGLFKTFLKWCAVDSLTEEETEGTFQKMLFTLGQVVY